MKKTLLLLVSILLISSAGYSQTKSFGKTPPYDCGQNEYIKNNPEAAAAIKDIDKKIQEFKKNKKGLEKSGPNGMTAVIPIVVTIVHGGVSQPENISDNQVLSQINALNTYFEPYGLKFCLAKKNSSGTPLTGANPGIQRVENAAATVLDIATEMNLLNPLTPSFPVERYLNIYIVKEFKVNGNGTTVVGIASLGPAGGYDGIAVKYNSFGDISDPLCTSCNLNIFSNQGKLLVHEVGHYLGLYHTFDGSCDEINGGDCENDGDHVCDTPPIFQRTIGCPANANTCNEGLNDQPDLINNYMDYSEQECQDSFTPGQLERMWASFNVTRSILVSADNLMDTGITCIPPILAARFEAWPTYTPCAGTPISLNASSVDGATYFWDFGDGTTSTNQIISSHTFPASETPYTVTLTVTLNGESVNVSKQIRTTNCTPINNSKATWFFSFYNLLDFSTGVPIYQGLLNYPLNNTYQSSVQNSSTGQLQFFTNGRDVWNGSQTIINPSTPLAAGTADYHGTIIVPEPGTTNKYYIFTIEAVLTGTTYRGFRYTRVEMVGSTPVLSSINTVVPAPSGYTMGSSGGYQSRSSVAAIKSCNGYWIIVTLNKNGYDHIVVYSLTSQGIQYNSEFSISSTTILGETLSVSPNGNYILRTNSGQVFIHDFDKINGVILPNPSIIALVGPRLTFSPDSKVLYGCTSDKLYQYDMTAANIEASRILLQTTSFPKYFYGVEMGPDNKGYVCIGYHNTLGVIHKPNVLATQENPNACQFSMVGPRIISNAFNLPNILIADEDTVFTNTLSHSAISCYEHKFTANMCTTNFSWNFGDPGSPNNLSTLANPTHVFTGAGTYTITMTSGGQSWQTQITIGTEAPEITGATCASNDRSTHYATAGPGQTIQWSIVSGGGTFDSIQTGHEASVIWTSLPGIVRLTVTDAMGCTATSEQTVTQCSQNPGEPGCASDFLFTLPENSALASYSVSNSIITQNNYQVNSGSDITLKAASFILVKPESHIKPGSLFLAKIADCVAPRPGMKSNDEIIERLVAYPNPTDELLYLEGSKFNEVYLFDLLGKSVFYSKYDNIDTATINMASLQQGIYFLKVTKTDGSTETLKIIKK